MLSGASDECGAISGASGRVPECSFCRHIQQLWRIRERVDFRAISRMCDRSADGSLILHEDGFGTRMSELKPSPRGLGQVQRCLCRCGTCDIRPRVRLQIACEAISVWASATFALGPVKLASTCLPRREWERLVTAARHGTYGFHKFGEAPPKPSATLALAVVMNWR